MEDLVVEGGVRMGGFSSPGPAAASSQEMGELTVDRTIVAWKLLEECGTGVRRWGVNGHCYFWVSIKPGVSWERFGLYCAQYGAYLATLTSTYEETFVRTMFDPPHSPLGRAWIGYSDARSEGTWEWVTGELAVTGNDTTYANWATGEPNDSNGEDCAEMIPGGWNDEDCSYEQIEYAVCERDH